jgi:hypothetical protein
MGVDVPSFGYGEGLRITYRNGKATALELLRS